jgi:PIN domain nuclease of toxin-antitoxin system
LKVLLDTNALIWWLEDNRKLGPRARRRLADSRTTPIATIISLWEMTMKFRAGKMKQPGSALLPFLAEQQVELIEVRLEHLRVLDSLAKYHDDPFDHLILAQAKAEGAVLMTSDDNMRLYGVPCIDTD